MITNLAITNQYKLAINPRKSPFFQWFDHQFPMLSLLFSMVPQEGDPFRGVAVGLRGRDLGQHGDHHGEGRDVHHGRQEVLGEGMSSWLSWIIYMIFMDHVFF
jgi:hypothetical protein